MPGAEHADLLDPFCMTASSNPTFHWPGLTAEVLAEQANGTSSLTMPYLQGYGVGGASNINGMGADRGHPDDYDEWSKLGAPGWVWQDVLPYFRKLEHDLDFAATTRHEMHGDAGLMPVRRLERTRWAPFARAVAQAIERRGYPFIDDYNADWRDGFSSVPTNCLSDRRVSASMAYLSYSVRRRANLTILSQARADALNLRHKRATGVSVLVDGVQLSLRSHQVIVACGAVQSPTLLMRSGIGPCPSGTASSTIKRLPRGFYRAAFYRAPHRRAASGQCASSVPTAVAGRDRRYDRHRPSPAPPRGPVAHGGLEADTKILLKNVAQRPLGNTGHNTPLVGRWRCACARFE